MKVLWEEIRGAIPLIFHGDAYIRSLLWVTLRVAFISTAIALVIGLPIGLAMKTAAPIVSLSARFNEASDENAREALEQLPSLLDRVDSYVASGVLNSDQLNAADFQIAPSIGLAMTLDDLRPAIENRPAGALARRIVPNYPGRMPAVLPAEWLSSLRPSS